MERDTRKDLSELSDDEYLVYLYTKEDPTEESLQSALRLEAVLGTYRALLEQIHRLAVTAVSNGSNGPEVATIKTLCAPFEEELVSLH